VWFGVAKKKVQTIDLETITQKKKRTIHENGQKKTFKQEVKNTKPQKDHERNGKLKFFAVKTLFIRFITHNIQA